MSIATKNGWTEYIRLVNWIVARVGVLARRDATKNEWEKLGREIEARAEKLKRMARVGVLRSR